MYNAASVRPVEGLRGASSKSETISSRRARPVLTLTASDPWCLDLDGDADIYPRRPGRGVELEHRSIARSAANTTRDRPRCTSWGNKTWRILATLQCADETGLTGGCRTSPAPGGLPVYMHACTEYLLRPSTHMHDACICQQDYSNFGQGNESSVLILFFLV
jgi:hypothetical protein